MSDIDDRLAKGAAILWQLDQRRSETATPRWGHDTEYEIVHKELCDLEAEILRNPCGLEAQLVRVRRNRRSR
jgi:hypothetical protein